MRPAIFICIMLLAVNGQLQYQPPQLSVNTGSSQYVTYYEGSLPLILAAPHGGRLFPTSIPDRTPAEGTITVTDAYTRDVVLGLARKIHERTGAMPHVVLLQIARTKVDVNRDKSDGADSDAGRMVWQEYHDTVKHAIGKVSQKHSSGLFIDIHGHGHPENWIELGYLLDNYTLELTDEQLNRGVAINRTSIQSLLKRYPDMTFSSFLRGDTSLGSRLAVKHHLISTPSKEQPHPHRSQKYFAGGYCTQTYGSRNGGDMDAIQIELPKTLRFPKSGRENVVMALSESLVWMVQTFYQVEIRSKM